MMEPSRGGLLIVRENMALKSYITINEKPVRMGLKIIRAFFCHRKKGKHLGE